MEAKPFHIQSHMHACMRTHSPDLGPNTLLNTNTNTINIPKTNTIANTLVRTVFKYKYKYFP